MAIKTIANIIVPAATMQALTPNVLNYVSLDGATLSSGQSAPTLITSFPPGNFIYNGGYYNGLKVSMVQGAQTGLTGGAIDIYTIYPPNTTLVAGYPITAGASTSPGRLALAAAAAQIQEDLIYGTPVGGVNKDNAIYGHFIVTMFVTTAPSVGTPVQILIQGWTSGANAVEKNF